MDDIRVKFALNKNIKTKRLIKACGFESYFCLINLWVYVAQNAPKGKLKGYHKSDLEIISEWTGDEGIFADALIQIGWVEEYDSGIMMHDWEEHQGFVYNSDERKIQARNAGLKSGEVRAEQKSTDSSTGSSTDSSTVRGTEGQLNANPLPFPSLPIPFQPNQKKKKDSDKSESPLDEKYSEFVLELFPEVKNKQLESQAQVIEQIHRIDKFDISQLLEILQWALKDNFWKNNFLSCAPLRKRKDGAGDVMKWEKIKAAYEKDNGELSNEPTKPKPMNFICDDCKRKYQFNPTICQNTACNSSNISRIPKEDIPK